MACDTKSYLGAATWYSLCDGTNGAGASFGCACDDSLNHIAYPHLNQTGCANDCYALPNHSYCQWIDVQYVCGYCVSLRITDCPCFNGCGSSSCMSCCSHYSNPCQSVSPPIADLTRTAFQSLGGNLNDGIIPVRLFA